VAPNNSSVSDTLFRATSLNMRSSRKKSVWHERWAATACAALERAAAS
jgi:hypothetical protein